jgi:hypothetical protein
MLREGGGGLEGKIISFRKVTKLRLLFAAFGVEQKLRF